MLSDHGMSVKMLYDTGKRVAMYINNFTLGLSYMIIKLLNDTIQMYFGLIYL